LRSPTPPSATAPCWSSRTYRSARRRTPRPTASVPSTRSAPCPRTSPPTGSAPVATAWQAARSCSLGRTATPGATPTTAIGAAASFGPPRSRRASPRARSDGCPTAASGGVTTDPRPYDLRHTFVSLLIQEGRSTAYVAEQAGHTVEECARTYTHLFDEYRDATPVPAQDLIQRTRARAEHGRAALWASTEQPLPRHRMFGKCSGTGPMNRRREPAGTGFFPANRRQADGGIRTLDPRFTSQLRRGKRRVPKGPGRASMPCKFDCSEIRTANGRTRGFST
jgi:hypothetical protein